MPLSVVYPPSDSTTQIGVDIVAVHGLGGDAVETWSHSKSGKFWLKDFLPQQIPDARILTFGYNADFAFGQSTSGIIDHAKGLLSSLDVKRNEPESNNRPLIFIAHSLGGIVVKQALLQARLEPLYQTIRDATVGILFFGTPHRGSNKANYGTVLSEIAQRATHLPSSQLLRALKKDSKELDRLASDFRHELSRYKIVSFYETKPMRMFRSLIVDQHSALLEVNGEQQIPVDANHMEMCKFETVNDDSFEKAYKGIQRIRSALQQGQETAQLSYNEHFDVPHLLSSVFTGRKEILKRLETFLLSSSSQNRSVQRRFVLHGLGGSGKTQICLRYLQSQREKYWGIFWIDASSHESIDRSMIQIAQWLNVDKSVDSVKRVLSNSPKSWLLVFDNADDPELELNKYFPTGDRGHIIITSRNPGCQIYSPAGHEQVGPMSNDDALSLLLEMVGADNDKADIQIMSEGGEKIVKVLGYLALAISHAAAYISETGCTPADYLELYQRQRSRLLGYFPQKNSTDYGFTVYTTWQVSLDRIASMPGAQGQYALQILRILCFYHHEQIPLAIFENAWSNKEELDHLEWLPWARLTSDPPDFRQSIQASVTLLASFSLVSRDSSALSLSVHPLVHEWSRDRMTADEQGIHAQRALILLAASIRWKFETHDFAFRRLVVSHVQSCGGAQNPNTDTVRNFTAWAWIKMALVLRENGLSQYAVSFWEKAALSLGSDSGEIDTDPISLMMMLSDVYSDAGPQSKALELAEQVVCLTKTILGEGHPDTLVSMSQLANHYDAIGRPEEALKLSEQIVPLMVEKSGKDNRYTLVSMNNLANRYSSAGRPEEGLKLAEQVFELQKEKLGEHHPETLASMNNLANRYSDAGRPEEGLKLAEQVFELQKEKLGEHHPYTLASMYNLALFYYEARRLQEALSFAERTLQLHKIKFGEDNPDTKQSAYLLIKLQQQAETSAHAKPAIPQDQRQSTDIVRESKDKSQGSKGFWQKLRTRQN